MKKILLPLSILAFSHHAFSQNATQLRNVERMRNKDMGAVSGGNPWVIGSGSQLGYMFGGSKDFSDALLVSASILYDQDFKKEGSKFHFPIMGNISPISTAIGSGKSKDQIESTARDILASNKGLSVGAYPWYSVIDNENFGLTAYLGLGWKLNSGTDTISNVTTYLHQGRGHFGLEARVGKSFTFSVSPFYSIFDADAYEAIFKENLTSIKGMELTIIAPIGNGIGFVLENTMAIERKPVLRVGIIFTKSLLEKS